VEEKARRAPPLPAAYSRVPRFHSYASLNGIGAKLEGGKDGDREGTNLGVASGTLTGEKGRGREE